MLGTQKEVDGESGGDGRIESEQRPCKKEVAGDSRDLKDRSLKTDGKKEGRKFMKWSIEK